MADAHAVALCLRYPEPGRLEELTARIATLDVGPVREALEGFVREIGKLDLAGWEELHTVTLDLSPLFVPYVGHAVWGENYRRGAFMADLSRAMTDEQLDLGGELPDHLEPVLRYLETSPAPLPDLVEVLPQALMRMEKELRAADKRNPYRLVIDAARSVAEAVIERRREVVT